MNQSNAVLWIGAVTVLVFGCLGRVNHSESGGSRDDDLPPDDDDMMALRAELVPAPPSYWYVDTLPLVVSVGGSDVSHYRYRLDEGPWSQERSVSIPISLDDVPVGVRQLEVEGRDAAGAWQSVPTQASFHMITVARRDIACILASDGGTCDHIVQPGAATVYLANPDAGPLAWETPLALPLGGRVCLAAGAHGARVFHGYLGTPGTPFEIVNCGGQVSIEKTSGSGAALDVYGGRYLSIRGSGSTTYEYGIVISAPGSGTHGVQMHRGASDYELAFLEIAIAGNHGIDAKSDSTSAERCAGFHRAAFIQYNTFVHHNYVRNTEYEGMYAGSSHWESTFDDNCAGTTVQHQEHELHGVRVHDNIVEDAGNDGIQIGCAPENTEVYQNVVRNVALRQDVQHASAIQLSAGTTGAIYGNLLDGAGVGIFLASPGDILVANNVIDNVAGMAIVSQHHVTIPGASNYYVNNTMLRSAFCAMGANDMCWCGPGNVICRFGTASVADVFVNNLVFNMNLPSGSSTLTVDENISATTPTEHLVDPDSGNYQLLETSVAVNAGANASMFGVTTDFTGEPRDEGNYDVGAYELRP